MSASTRSIGSSKSRSRAQRQNQAPPAAGCLHHLLKKREGGSGIPSPYMHGSVGKRFDEQALVQDV